MIAADGTTLLDHLFETQDAVTDEGEAAITSFTDEAFTVRFPRITEDGTVLKIRFVNQVLAYSSDFAGPGPGGGDGRLPVGGGRRRRPAWTRTTRLSNPASPSSVRG